jgi:hypothetical protein
MTRPQTYLTRMAVFIGVVIVAAIALFRLFDTIEDAFMQNPWFNGPIVGVLVLGIAYVCREVLKLYPVVRWIETFRRERDMGLSIEAAPPLLAPMATMLGERQGRLSLSALSMRTLLDGVSSRLDESRDISRYLIALLIFLGLLGTFWGLLQTIFSVGDVVRSLSVGEGDNVATIFQDLTAGLQAPLHGMGIAFSSSLFGLAGSLILGFLDLQASQAQNRFYNELEDWLSSLTRLGGGPVGEAADGGDGQAVPAYVHALLEQTADSLDTLQRTLTRGEESRISADGTLMKLNESLAALTDQMRAEQKLLEKLVEHQVNVKPALERLSELSAVDVGGVDEATRAHVRNIDLYMTRLVEETVSGRVHLAEELRSEIKLLARTIAARNGVKAE